MGIITWDFTNAPVVNKTPNVITWNAEIFANPIKQSSFSGWNGTISSDYGKRTFEGEVEFHRGVDIALPEGTDLEANISGEVIASGDAITQGYDASYGNIVVVKDKIGQEHLYGHLDSTSVKVGEHVNVGTQIGDIGSTGHSTGSHLHYEITWKGQPIDPMQYIQNAQHGNSFVYTQPKNYDTRQELNELSQMNESSGNAFVDFIDFINDVRGRGLSYALFDKSFEQVIVDALVTTAKGIGIFITGNSDIFFLLPAIAFLFLTFMVGRNRFTKWIIPLLTIYLFSRGIYHWLV